MIDTVSYACALNEHPIAANHKEAKNPTECGNPRAIHRIKPLPALIAEAPGRFTRMMSISPHRPFRERFHCIDNKVDRFGKRCIRSGMPHSHHTGSKAHGGAEVRIGQPDTVAMAPIQCCASKKMGRGSRVNRKGTAKGRHLKLRFYGDNFVLDTVSGRFYRLTPIAGTVLRALIEGKKSDDLASIVSRKFGTDPAKAATSIELFLSDLSSLELIENPAH